MPDVAAMYGFAVNQAHKALCPFHQDSKPSLHIYDGQKGWYCYVCGQGGDIIRFVQRLFGLSFQDSLIKLNNDFRLGFPIGEELSAEAQKEMNRIAYQRRKEQEQRKKRHETLLTAYHSALDEWIRLDKTIRDETPETPFDGFTAGYTTAIKKIDIAAYRLDVAETELRRFERQ